MKRVLLLVIACPATIIAIVAVTIFIGCVMLYENITGMETHI